MSTAALQQLSQFAQDVVSGLSDPSQKRLAPKYFYDELGSALFEAITLLPEYGLTRADERLLEAHAAAISSRAGWPGVVAELGSGSGRKTRHILKALSSSAAPEYYPIDISPAALDVCANELHAVARVHPVAGEWMKGLDSVMARRNGEPLMLLFLGSSIGNLGRSDLPDFFLQIRSKLRSGDFFLLGADLLKPIASMLRAYDDSTGVTAAFNLNLLGRMNRELGADFDLRAFSHEARWNAVERAVEMHLVSSETQAVHFRTLQQKFAFLAGESIWTESSHKFTERELLDYARGSGFAPVHSWVDQEWPFLEALWVAA